MTAEKSEVNNYAITAILMGNTDSDIGVFSEYTFPNSGPYNEISYYSQDPRIVTIKIINIRFHIQIVVDILLSRI